MLWDQNLRNPNSSSFPYCYLLVIPSPAPQFCKPKRLRHGFPITGSYSVLSSKTLLKAGLITQSGCQKILNHFFFSPFSLLNPFLPEFFKKVLFMNLHQESLVPKVFSHTHCILGNREELRPFPVQFKPHQASRGGSHLNSAPPQLSHNRKRCIQCDSKTLPFTKTIKLFHQNHTLLFYGYSCLLYGSSLICVLFYAL